MILQIDFPIGTMSSVEFSPLFSIGLFLESSSQESHQGLMQTSWCHFILFICASNWGSCQGLSFFKRYRLVLCLRAQGQGVVRRAMHSFSIFILSQIASDSKTSPCSKSRFSLLLYTFAQGCQH